ncbi:MAG: aminotransferase class I/II-fold pyridoxal phosphate-dependent enzyme [Lachnospiraceae bacterium]|nr:aminotransferase class I/II-fold pyridoxal phosphate-dependent enzyme [Lachnospiraceae bacterium]
MAGLFESLEEYGKSGRYPFHMPGHKRDPEFVKVADCDITEIEGFDDLHHAEGILRDCGEYAGKLYNGTETHFLVNGSTGGIQAAVAAAAGPGEYILAARNSHKALYNAAAVTGVKLEYIYPRIDERYGCALGITADEAAEVLDICLLTGKAVKAVYITSPTYEGMVSDVRGIAKECHKRGIPLIVDEAHGAHFGFDERLPESSAGIADIVIHSVHKTLPSLTQTALIHLSGDIIDRDRVRYMLTVFQSSSPSYILMASIDRCMEMMADRAFVKQHYDRLFANIERLKRAISGGSLKLLDTDDPTRLLIGAENGSMAGPEIYRELENSFNIEPEMYTPFYTVLISTLCDTDEGFDLLIGACTELGKRSYPECGKAPVQLSERMKLFDAGTALRMGKSIIPADKAEGSISGGYIYVYPPGIPMIVPGEVIDKKVTDEIKMLLDQGFEVRGLSGDGIPVVRTERDRG